MASAEFQVILHSLHVLKKSGCPRLRYVWVLDLCFFAVGDWMLVVLVLVLVVVEREKNWVMDLFFSFKITRRRSSH